MAVQKRYATKASPAGVASLMLLNDAHCWCLNLGRGPNVALNSLLTITVLWHVFAQEIKSDTGLFCLELGTGY